MSTARYGTAENRLVEIINERRRALPNGESMSQFTVDLERYGSLLVEFDEELWYETVETEGGFQNKAIIIEISDYNLDMIGSSMLY